MSKKPIQIGVGRLTWLSVLEPKAYGEGDKPKYASTILLPKGQGLEVGIRDAVNSVLHDSFPSNKIGGANNPIKDGDIDKYDLHDGHWVIRASSIGKPYILDKYLKEILEEDTREDVISREKIYNGCYGIILVSPYSYDMKGNYGVALGLETVIKVGDGEELAGGRMSLEDTRAAVVAGGYVLPGGAPAPQGLPEAQPQSYPQEWDNVGPQEQTATPLPSNEPPYGQNPNVPDPKFRTPHTASPSGGFGNIRNAGGSRG